ncbi:hypothetical protein ADEAN_000701100 [Angomonas deanei]|uniref:Uncharacterized protein n=1 Tax=Angomonas deanei TaxID=59799 RepID=A0A7G2CLS2_9TRYP|nr:hypothetical protein ADEAN_000701100 [Angomonas deanei]
MSKKVETISVEEVRRIKTENDQLKTEIASLKNKIIEEKQKYKNEYGLENHKVREAITAVQGIEARERDAEIVRTYRELVNERRKSAVLAEMLEEVRTHFFEIKRLYEHMEELQRLNNNNNNNSNQNNENENNNNNEEEAAALEGSHPLSVKSDDKEE